MQEEKNVRLLLAVDCLIFGFENQTLKVLLIKRKLKPSHNEWSLMGGYLKKNETTDEAAIRILQYLTGLTGVYMEQVKTFSHPDRDPSERTLSIVYTALIDISKFKNQLNHNFQAEWFEIKDVPTLIFDHNEILDSGLVHLRKKAALHPILFELMSEKFTILQIQQLYEEVFETNFDRRNFSRKLISSKLLKKLNEKDKSGSKKGAYYYQLNKEVNHYSFYSLLNLAFNQV